MIEAAQLSFSPEGIPFSEAYGDVYHTRSGGLGQARHVFLAGNDLPRRWQARRGFTILETGFGLGINFLATWAAWQDDAQRCERLDFVSVEKHPFHADDLARAHAPLIAAGDALAPLAAALQAAWPGPVAGRHTLSFADGAVTLTLLFADAREALAPLAESGLRADAFFLDGFSPARNPELWSPELLADLSRLAASEATLATWSVASGVRQALAANGWTLAKAPGFHGKRDMLRGRRGDATAL